MEKITEKFYLGSNKNTFVLYERKVSEEGKESFKKIGYCATLEAVHTTLLEKEIKDDLGVISNIEKIVNLVKELREFTIKYVDLQNKEKVEE